MPVPDQKSPALAWTLVLVAAVLLYVLTLPWIHVAQINATLRKPILSVDDLDYVFFPLSLNSGPDIFVIIRGPMRGSLEHL